MKRYKLYKKAEPVCCNFEELLSHIILPLVIASYASYPFLYFLGLESALVYNSILAVIATYFFDGLKKFIPILNDRDTTGFKSVFYSFVSFLIILSSLLITGFGFYLLVLYQKNNEFNIFHFYLWLLILFGFPLFYYAFRSVRYYYIKKQQDEHFVNIVLVINHDLDLFLAIDNIQFVNTANRNSSDIKITNNIQSYSQKEFIALKTKTRHYYVNKEGFRETVQIPFNASAFLLSWFSYTENKYYAVEFPFPFEKFIAEQETCSTDKFKIFRARETEPLYLHLYLNGGIRFFYKNVILVDIPVNNESAVNGKDKKDFFDLNATIKESYIKYNRNLR